MIDRHPECISLINAKAQSVSGRDPGGSGASTTIVDSSERFVDEFDPSSVTSQGANALKTSLWELAALQKHYHPSVATLVRFTLPSFPFLRIGLGLTH